MYKAGNGDCISIENESDFVLIDGGTAQSFDVWKSHIVGNINRIDSLIITHIDNDHVNGVIRLLANENCPNIVKVYFNGAQQLFGELDVVNKEDGRTERKLQALAGEHCKAERKEKIGYSEAVSLSYFLMAKGIKCNEVVGSEALYREKLDSFEVGRIKLTIIGPEKSSLDALREAWKFNLCEKRIKPKIISKSYYDAFELYANNALKLSSYNHPISGSIPKNINAFAYQKFESDSSLANESSFSFLIESGGKSILYLGDCHPETVISWLEINKIETIRVDAVKISHHGSKNNTSLEMLKRINCQKYLISTNGKSHNHPSLETIARIAVVNKDKKTEIHMNYCLDNIPGWFLNELDSEYPKIKLCRDSCEVEL